MNATTVSARKLQAFCRACFLKLRVPPRNAQLVAENLVFANLRGVDSHGVIRLKIYLERLRAGGFKPSARPVILQDRPSMALMDAQHGIGQVAAAAAMKLAVVKARKTGAGFVSIRNSNHFGAAAFYATRAIPHGMIGIAATNAGPTMAPTGGREGRLGNNAIAIAVPAGKSPPLILDMATGAVAWGKIFVAQQEKRKIPTTWALDRDGVPTDDPNAAAHQGLIQPFGGYKGYGLSLLIDIFTGVLSGGGFSSHVRTLYKQIDIPADVAQVCVALRIASFMPLGKFRRRMDEIIQLMHSCPAAAGVEGILVPGEIEHATAKRRGAKGIPISAELRAELQAIGAELRIRPPC